MNLENINKDQIMRILNEKRKPIGMVSLIMVALVITLMIPSGKNIKPKAPGDSNVVNNLPKKVSDSSEKSVNPFSFLFGTKNDSSNNQQITPTVVKVPPNIISSETSNSTVTRVLPNGTKTTQQVTGSTILNTSQGTINPNTNIASDIDSNTVVDNLRIVFQNPDGSTFTYIPPGTPPDEVRWARYTNNKEKYAINYPYNWQFVYSIDNGHEGIALYPPGSNPNDPNSSRIGFGIADNFLLPTVGGNTTGTHITPIVADGVSGNLYTNGALGNSYIATVFSYSGKYFGLASTKSDATFAYVYYYMLQSLTFNIE